MNDDIWHRILAAMPYAALVVALNDKVLAANAEAEALFGRNIGGAHFLSVLRAPLVLEAFERCQRTQERQTVRFTHTMSRKELSLSLTCGMVQIDGVAAALLSFEDLTQIEQAGQMRRDFVANVSHELRTPLTALLGFIETLRGPAREDSAARDRFLGIMAKEAERMNRLVSDLLSLSQVEAVARVRPNTKIHLNSFVPSVLRGLEPVAQASDVRFEMSLPDEEVSIEGDPDQFRQVLVNLIENAVKYGGQRATVTVRVIAIEHDAAIRGPAVGISVEDQGAGIDPVHISRLTERFYRVDGHRSREMGGTGLGLAIVKHIVQRHRGRLRIESEVGRGSVFSVVLPR